MKFNPCPRCFTCLGETEYYSCGTCVKIYTCPACETEKLAFCNCETIEILCRFVGRENGAIGVTEPIETIVEVKAGYTQEAIEKELYKSWEHISSLKTEVIDYSKYGENNV